MLTGNRFKSWLILIVLVLIWGSSFILIKRGLAVYSSQVVGALRIVVSFLVLLPLAIGRLKKVPSNKLLVIAISGIIGTAIPAFLFARAQTVIDSSLAGILNSLTPLFTLFIGISFFGQKSKWLSITGVIIGLIGATGLIASTTQTTFVFHFSFAIYVIIATVLYAIHSNLIKFYLQDVHPVSIASIGFFITGIPLTLYLFFFTDFTTVLIHHENGWMGLLYITLLGVFSSALAIILYNRLIQITNAVFASSVTYFIPVIALLWGVADGERFPFVAALYIGLILLGVFLVNLNVKREKKSGG